MTVAPGPLLVGKIAVVTGGGSGSGRAIAESFAVHGATVVVADARPDGVAHTADAIAAAGGKVIPVVADVTRRTDVERLTALAGEVDTLVNVAGEPPPAKRFVESSEGDWQALFGLDLGQVLLCCRAMVPGMIQRARGGTVVNVSTVGDDGESPRGAVDSALRAGVMGFTATLAREVDRHGIRVNAIAQEAAPAGRWHPADPVPAPGRAGVAGLARVAGASSAVGSAGGAADLAGVALFLASDLGASVTGTTVRVNRAARPMGQPGAG